MLSIDNPLEPSCPLKLAPLKSDEKGSDQVALQEADPVVLGDIQASNFSIRDYVFSSRSKDISTTWPFPQQLLKLCLNHGIRDLLLPPFEPPDLVRAQCCIKKVEPQPPVGCSEDKTVFEQADLTQYKGKAPLEEEEESGNLECEPFVSSDRSSVEQSEKYPSASVEGAKYTLDCALVDADIEIASTSTNSHLIERISAQTSGFPCLAAASKSASVASSDLEVDEPPPLQEEPEKLCEPCGKKIRVIVKSGASSEIHRAEDIASTSSTVSDPMASKVCPVCKVFASTSNTTLNAHIDQCLSVESDSNQVADKFAKLKVKPRKKRLMVDIYTTAPHCTLEDLDRRNGSNWATDLALVPAQTNEVDVEAKRPKFSPVSDDSDNEDVGAVYVDSNGIKLRILSKSNDPESVTSRVDFELKVNAKSMKFGRKSLISKKKHLGPKYLKYIQQKQQKKKMRSFKLNKNEIAAPSEEAHHSHSHQGKLESHPEMLNAQNQIKDNGAPSSLGQWACSKRSGLPRKVSNISKSSGNPILTDGNPVMETYRSDLVRCSSARSPIQNFSRSSEELISSPKTKTVTSLPNTAHTEHNGKKLCLKRPCLNSNRSSECPAANGLVLKLSGSAGPIISSPRSKREEIKESMPKSDNFPTIVKRPPERCQVFLKAKKGFNLKRSVSSLEASKTNGGQKHGITKKLRKHRSALGTGIHSDSSPDVNGVLHGCLKDSEFGTRRLNKKIRIYEPKCSEGVSRSETAEIQEQLTPTRTNNIELAQGEEMEALASQMGTTLPVDVVAEPSRKEGDDSSSGKTLVIENLVLASNAKVYASHSEEERGGSICQIRAQYEAVAESMYDEQEMACANVVDREVVDKNFHMECDAEARGEEESFRVQYTECHAETASMQGSSACLTAHAEAGMEVPQENSSVTSIRIKSTSNHDFANERETSESPVSASSTISPSPECFRSKDTDMQTLSSPSVVQAKLSTNNLGFPSTPSVGGNEGTKVESRNQEGKPEFSGDQPCCCSRRENLSRDPWVVRQSIMAGTTLPSNRKHLVSNLYIKPSIPSSFGPYSSLRSDMIASRVLESPTGSISTMTSSDSAAKFSNCRDFGSPSPTQSTSKPILRLMGKDLMVSNREESAQLPSPASDHPLTPRCLSPLGFPSPGGVLIQDGFAYRDPQQQQQFHMASSGFLQYPSFASNRVLPHPHYNQMAGFAGSPLQTVSSVMLDQQSPRRRSNKKPNSPSPRNLERLVPSHQQGQIPALSSQGDYISREVIVIDDTPETDTDFRGNLASPVGTSAPSSSGPNIFQQRHYSCFQPNAQLLSPEMLSSRNSSFPVSYPMMENNMVRQANSAHISSPLPPSQFSFGSPSSGYLHPSLYYSEKLR